MLLVLLLGTQVGYMQVLAGVVVGQFLVMCHFPVYPVHQVNGQSSGPDLSDVLDDMRWKAKNILLTDFDVRGHRTLERTLNDRSVPFLINGTDAGEAMRQALLEGKWIYCPQISKSMPDLHFLHAEKTCNRVMAYTKSPVNKTVYQEKNGKIIPYVPALKKVSKTKRNNSLKM